MQAPVLLALLLAAGSPAAQGQKPQPPAAAIVFAHVNVVSFERGAVAVLERQNVLVVGDTIVALGTSPWPPGTSVIEAMGKFLLPGFADMHVHLPEDEAGQDRALDLSLAHGITLIRSMAGSAGHLALRERLRGRPAPALVLGGPPIAQELTPEAARETVSAQKRAGYDFVKILGGFDRAAYRALASEAARTGLPLCGHVPKAVGLDEALRARQASIEHLGGYEFAAGVLADQVRRTLEAGVFNCPTLGFFSVGAEPESALLARAGLGFASAQEKQSWKGASQAAGGAERLAQKLQIVAALDRAGAPLLAGSDSPGAFSVPGFAYLEELGLLSRAGLDASRVLQAATANAARYLKDDRSGAVAVGKRADLVLLDGDPRRLEALKRPRGVMIRGQWLARADLDVLLARHARPK